MPAKVKPEKEKKVADIKEKFEMSKIMILTDYRGMSVKQITDLRRRLDAHKAEYRVLKNTLVAKALPESLSQIKDQLSGSVAILFGYEDIIMPAKTLVNFSEEAEKPKVMGGVVEGVFFEEAKIKELSRLPTRQVLLAKVVGGLQAPLYGLVNVLSGNLRKLVYVLDAVKNKKSQGGES